MTAASCRFIYKEEIWCVSVLLNSQFVDISSKLPEIRSLIEQRIASLSLSDFPSWLQDIGKEVLKHSQHYSLRCEWVPYIYDFHFFEENLNRSFDTIGYLKIYFEYYPADESRKAEIQPEFIQQLPALIRESLVEWNALKVNEHLVFDTDSPIFVFVTSDEVVPPISWSCDNIDNYKRVIGKWVEVYSGQWPDYSEELYDRRVTDNLSNRLSELHFIHRNSGFLFMEEENYSLFFHDYIQRRVIEPTFRIRSILFTLLKISASLDDLLLRGQRDYRLLSLSRLEQKIRALQSLRGIIRTKISELKSDLYRNRRQHYTSVLRLLLNQYKIDRVFASINQKFSLVNDTLSFFYQSKTEELQKKQERGMALLAFLFGLEFLISIGELILGIRGYGSLFALLVRVVTLAIIILVGGVMLFVSLRSLRQVRKDHRKTLSYAVDGVLIKDDQVLLIQRKNVPFAGQYALPGGFIDSGETAAEAVVRELEEETSLEVRVVRKIGVYDDPGRDPRGRVISTAFLCEPVKDVDKLKEGTDALRAEFLPIEKVIGLNLAFDHEDIFNDALELYRKTRNK